MLLLYAALKFYFIIIYDLYTFIIYAVFDH